MSITFYPEITPIVGYRIEDHRGGRPPMFDTYDTAGEELAAMTATGGTRPGCTDPDEALAAGISGHVTVVTADDGQDPTMNVSNAHAQQILALLGVPGDATAGMAPAEALTGTVLDALTVAAWTNGGRPAEYVQHRLADLEHIAEWAHDHGRSVCWGRSPRTPTGKPGCDTEGHTRDTVVAPTGLDSSADPPGGRIEMTTTSDLHREARELLAHREKWGVLDPAMTWAVRELLAESEQQTTELIRLRTSTTTVRRVLEGDDDTALRVACIPQDTDDGWDF